MKDSWIRAYFILLTLAWILTMVVVFNLDARLTRLESHNTSVQMRLDLLEMKKQEQTIKYYNDIREPYKAEEDEG